MPLRIGSLSRGLGLPDEYFFLFRCNTSISIPLEFRADCEVSLSRAYEAVQDSGNAARARELSNLFKNPILYLN